MQNHRAKILPGPPPEVAVGVPADLLRQRPDIRRAERRLAAQTARVGVATADLYPRVRLLGTVGLNATDIKNLATTESIIHSFGPSFDWNIFDAGRIRNV